MIEACQPCDGGALEAPRVAGKSKLHGSCPQVARHAFPKKLTSAISASSSVAQELPNSCPIAVRLLSYKLLRVPSFGPPTSPLGHVGPHFDRVGPHLAKCRTSLANVGEILVDVGQRWPKLGQPWSSIVRLGPNRQNVVPTCLASAASGAAAAASSASSIRALSHVLSIPPVVRCTPCNAGPRCGVQ